MRNRQPRSEMQVACSKRWVADGRLQPLEVHADNATAQGKGMATSLALKSDSTL